MREGECTREGKGAPPDTTTDVPELGGVGGRGQTWPWRVKAKIGIEYVGPH